MKKYVPYVLFAFLTLLVMAPLYHGGYVFLLDMVFSPSHLLPPITNGVIPSSYPVFALVALAAQIIGSTATEKIILSLIFFLPAVFMYRLSMRGKVFAEDSAAVAHTHKPDGWAILAGVFYAFNPWTYERWLSGQWLVMLGYALFPLAVAWLWDLLEAPGSIFSRSGAGADISLAGISGAALAFSPRKKLWCFVALCAVYPIVDLHFAYLFAGFAIIFLIVWAAMNRRDISRWSLRRFAVAFVIIACVALAANSFWLVSAAHGQGAYAGISSGDFRAFVTQSDPHLGTWFNVLSLYGFWSNDYNLPKDTFPLWWVVTLGFVAFAIAGVVRGVKKKRPLLIATAIAFIPAWIFAVGYANGFSMAITQWATAAIPGFRGLRETEKFGGVLAFAFALLIAAGGRSLARRFGKDARAVLWLAGILVFLAVYDMPFAFAGQVTSGDYPASWYAANTIMATNAASDVSSDTAVLVFPWEAYFDLSFAGFHQVADPAPQFFSVPVVASADTGNPDITAPLGMWDKYAFNVVQGTANPESTSQFLMGQHVGYVLLLKESDWQRYSALDDDAHLVKVLDAPELTLYKVE